LQAVSSGPGKQLFIDLIWAPVSDVDLAGYNVYRRTDGGSAVKVNTKPLRVPAYRDNTVDHAKRYAYSVTAADSRGNESAHSEEATETVP
jgi:fibronectin type 3 domain-containing protein